MPKIKPIKDLRNTIDISKECHESNEPIFITKNGYQDMVIMSDEYYESIINKHDNNINKEYISAPKRYNPKEMSDCFGYVKCASTTINTKVGDVEHNLNEIIKNLELAYKENVKILVFPELTLTGYSCRDLFYSNSLQEQTLKAIKKLKTISKKYPLLFFVGAPIFKNNGIYNCALAFYNGEILGVSAKTHLPTYNEFYESRQFIPSPKYYDTITINGEELPFGNKLLYKDERYPSLIIGCEICEDVWVPNNPSLDMSLTGATLIVNLSASNEIVGKSNYRESLISSTSAREICGYVYCSAGEGESTTDVVYSGHNIIAENGRIIAQSELFKNSMTIGVIDINKLCNDRRRMSTFKERQDDRFALIGFDMPLDNNVNLDISPNPFLVSDEVKAKKRYRNIIKMQASGLKSRFIAAHSKTLVLGLSGGLDSTLALLVAKECMSQLNMDPKNVIAITLPAFGTSSRTHDNALKLADALGVTFKEINVKESVLLHLKDIQHDVDNHNTTYENAQARERTQVLMDYANDVNGLMVGTGDLSELCLGWTTYNGDHMSMYGVNASIPKTLVQALVRTYADDHIEAKEVLYDILDTPISPELLPLKNGEIEQKTEDKVGPYELVDFFIYYYLRRNFSLKKIVFLAKQAYKDKYDEEAIKKWLRVFIKRFYASQFKRSCLPDGVKIGSVSISPRGDLRMPSDASCESLLKELD